VIQADGNRAMGHAQKGDTVHSVLETKVCVSKSGVKEEGGGVESTLHAVQRVSKLVASNACVRIIGNLDDAS
jgi:hypothetical protein